MTGNGGPFGPGHPDTVNGECYGYAWLGQSFEYCDICPLPYWEHRFEAALDRETGTWYRKPIAPEQADRVRRKWEEFSK